MLVVRRHQICVCKNHHFCTKNTLSFFLNVTKSLRNFYATFMTDLASSVILFSIKAGAAVSEPFPHMALACVSMLRPWTDSGQGPFPIGAHCLRVYEDCRRLLPTAVTMLQSPRPRWSSAKLDLRSQADDHERWRPLLCTLLEPQQA